MMKKIFSLITLVVMLVFPLKGISQPVSNAACRSISFPKSKSDTHLYQYIPNKYIETLFQDQNNALLYFDDRGEAVYWTLPDDLAKSIKKWTPEVLYSDSKSLLIQIAVKKKTYFIELDHHLNYVRHFVVPASQTCFRVYPGEIRSIEKSFMQDGVLTVIMSCSCKWDVVYSPTLTALNTDYFTAQVYVKYFMYRIDWNNFTMLTSKDLGSRLNRCYPMNLFDGDICFSPNGQMLAVSIRAAQQFVAIYDIEGNSKGLFNLSDARFQDVYGAVEVQDDGSFTCFGYTKNKQELVIRTVRDTKVVNEQNISIPWEENFDVSNIQYIKRNNEQYVFLCYGKQADGDKAKSSYAILTYAPKTNVADTWILNLKCNSYVNLHSSINPKFVFLKDYFYVYDAPKDAYSYRDSEIVVIGDLKHKTLNYSDRFPSIIGVLLKDEDANVIYFEARKRQADSECALYFHDKDNKMIVTNGLLYINRDKLVSVGYKGCTISPLPY